MTSAECCTAVVLLFIVVTVVLCVGVVMFGPCFAVHCLVSSKACNLIAGGGGKLVALRLLPIRVIGLIVFCVSSSWFHRLVCNV